MLIPGPETLYIYIYPKYDHGEFSTLITAFCLSTLIELLSLISIKPKGLSKV